MAEKMNGLSLDFIIHPGETLKEVLEEKQMIQASVEFPVSGFSLFLIRIMQAHKEVFL